MWIEQLNQDVRYAVRQLHKNRGFAAAAVVVLGFGIGANAAVFNLVHSLLFAPPHYARPDEVVRVLLREKKNPKSTHDISYSLYRDIKEWNGILSDTLAYSLMGVGLGENGATRRAIAALVTSNYFAVLGVAPVQGRAFLPEEATPGRKASVAIVSHSFWRKRGFDPKGDAAGEHISLVADAQGAETSATGAAVSGDIKPGEMIEVVASAELAHAFPKILLFCLPVFALLTRFLFRAAAQSYLQHLVAAVHITPSSFSGNRWAPAGFSSPASHPPCWRT